MNHFTFTDFRFIKLLELLFQLWIEHNPEMDKAIYCNAKYVSKLQGSIPFKMVPFQNKLQSWEMSDSNWSTHTRIKVPT